MQSSTHARGKASVGVTAYLTKPILVYPVFLSLTRDGKASIFLGKLYSISGSSLPIKDGWFTKSSSSWLADTQLTRQEQGYARAILRNLGILQERVEAGKIIWYRLDMEAFENLLKEHVCPSATSIQISP